MCVCVCGGVDQKNNKTTLNGRRCESIAHDLSVTLKTNKSIQDGAFYRKEINQIRRSSLRRQFIICAAAFTNEKLSTSQTMNQRRENADRKLVCNQSTNDTHEQNVRDVMRRCPSFCVCHWDARRTKRAKFKKENKKLTLLVVQLHVRIHCPVPNAIVFFFFLDATLTPGFNFPFLKEHGNTRIESTTTKEEEEEDWRASSFLFYCRLFVHSWCRALLHNKKVPPRYDRNVISRQKSLWTGGGMRIRRRSNIIINYLLQPRVLLLLLPLLLLLLLGVCVRSSSSSWSRSHDYILLRTQQSDHKGAAAAAA